jgi:hypothetical protein
MYPADGPATSTRVCCVCDALWQMVHGVQKQNSRQSSANDPGIPYAARIWPRQQQPVHGEIRQLQQQLDPSRLCVVRGSVRKKK